MACGGRFVTTSSTLRAPRPCVNSWDCHCKYNCITTGTWRANNLFSIKTANVLKVFTLIAF